MIDYEDKYLYFKLSIFGFLLFFSELIAFRLIHYKYHYGEATLVIAYALSGLAIGALVEKALKIDSNKLFILCLLFQIPLSFIFFYTYLISSPDVTILFNITSTLFFICPGIFISHAFSNFSVSKTYYYDLIGASISVVIFLYFINSFLIEKVFLSYIFILIFFSLTYFIFLYLKSNLFKLFSLTIISFTLFFTFCILKIPKDLNLFNFLAKDHNKISWKRYGNNYDLVRSYENSVSRIDIFSTPRRKGDLRFTYTDNAVSQDAFYPSFPGDHYRDPRVLMELVEDPKVFILGASAQGIVKSVRAYARPENIIAFEINPSLIEVMESGFFARSSNYPYNGVTVKQGNALAYLKNTNQKFDVITNMNAHSMGHMFLEGPPDYIHTKEAYKLMFESLTGSGFFMLEQRPLTVSSQKILNRRIVTIYEALRATGAKYPRQHLLIYTWQWDTKKKLKGTPFTSIIIKKSPYTKKDLNKVYDLLRIKARNWKDLKGITYIEASSSDKANSHLKFNHIPFTFVDNNLKKLFISLDKRGFERNRQYMPVTNNNPFSFFVDNAFIKKTVKAIPLIVFIFLFIVLILFLSSRNRKFHFLTYKVYIYQFLVGFGYIGLEILLINYYLGDFSSTVLSFGLVLILLLVSSAIGGRYISSFKNLRLKFIFFIFSILFHMLLRDLIFYYFPLSNFIKYLLIIILVINTGFWMGIFFPLGQKALVSLHKNYYLSYGFIVNCLGGVFASASVYFALVFFGFYYSFLICIIFYYIAFKLICSNHFLR